MKYDPALPIAVFLGPSLDLETARAILPANYYPPVRMGDVYRLATCGVRLIVVIDGVFHNTAPVWPREILAAIDNGIVVVGASSMGALRAVELAPYGMIGCGTVVDWYQSGRIEGDDEVALLHAEAEFGYRALSEPMVNIRDTLAGAVRAGILTPDGEDQLAAAMKALDYTRRSYPALFASDAFAGLPAAAQEALRAFVAAGGDGLKRQDARAALEWAVASLAGQASGGSGADRGVPRGGESMRVERPDEILRRGVPGPEHELVSLGDLLVQAAGDSAWIEQTRRDAVERLLLLDWMRAVAITPPDGTTDRFAAGWRRHYAIDDEDAWLVANGLTRMELAEQLAERAASEWLQEQGPEVFGLTRPFLEAWAECRGIEPPRTPSPRSFSERILDKGPGFFGFDLWSADIACIRELQMTGQIAQRAWRTAHAGAGVV